MRRYLGALLTISSATLLVLGCALVPVEPTGVGGSGGGGASESTTSVGAGGAGYSSGPRSEVASVSDSSTPLAGCNPLMQPTPPVSLSVPSARAMVSGARVRGLLGSKEKAVAPPPSLVSASEIFNYNHIAYPAKSDTELTIVTELTPTNKLGDYLLQIGVQAPTAKAPRRPTSVTVLVDTSKSMEGESMIRANAAVSALAASLNKDDVLSFLTTDPEIKPVSRHAQSDGDPELFPENTIAVSGGGTVAKGLERAYEQATSKESYLEGGLNRLVVITDGGSLPSSIDTESIAGYWRDRGIRLVGVGVGSAATYKNDLLAAATTAGHGPSLYLDSAEEAKRALHERFDEVMDEAVGDVSITFRLPWIFKPVGAELPIPTDIATPLTRSDLGRGRSMIFRRPVTVCGGGGIDAAADLPIEVTATWTVPGAVEERSVTTLVPLKEALIGAASNQMVKASAILSFANALQSLDIARFQDACAKVATARAQLAIPTSNDPDPGDPELDLIQAQLAAHPVLGGKPCP